MEDSSIIVPSSLVPFKRPTSPSDGNRDGAIDAVTTAAALAEKARIARRNAEANDTRERLWDEDNRNGRDIPDYTQAELLYFHHHLKDRIVANGHVHGGRHAGKKITMAIVANHLCPTLFGVKAGGIRKRCMNCLDYWQRRGVAPRTQEEHAPLMSYVHRWLLPEDFEGGSTPSLPLMRNLPAKRAAMNAIETSPNPKKKKPSTSYFSCDDPALTGRDPRDEGHSYKEALRFNNVRAISLKYPNANPSGVITFLLPLQDNGRDEAHDKLHLLIQITDVNPYAAALIRAKLSPRGDALTVQHPLQDSFFLTRCEPFSMAVARADKAGGDDDDNLRARLRLALEDRRAQLVDAACLSEQATLLGAQSCPVTVPMSETTYLFPDGLTCNNQSFNDEGTFEDEDKWSLVPKFIQVNDMVSDAEFEGFDVEGRHEARRSQHGAVWVGFTMAVDKPDKDSGPKKKTPIRSATVPAFTFQS
mmetsp:Transcript_54396/g.115540  ORF Transcript_54396/g.115540 Transcript_54396/m.115540 type:complete len:474 (+) Transcript_54396:6-1427(+)